MHCIKLFCWDDVEIMQREHNSFTNNSEIVYPSAVSGNSQAELLWTNYVDLRERRESQIKDVYFIHVKTTDEVILLRCLSALRKENALM